MGQYLRLQQLSGRQRIGQRVVGVVVRQTVALAAVRQADGFDLASEQAGQPSGLGAAAVHSGFELHGINNREKQRLTQILTGSSIKKGAFQCPVVNHHDAPGHGLQQAVQGAGRV